MKLPEKYVYPAIMHFEEGKEISVVFPDLDAATSGENELDAMNSARELLGAVMYGLEQDGEPIPKPTPLQMLPTGGMNDVLTLVDVYMPTIRLATVTRSVTRTVTLPAWLNAAACERNVNFSQVLQDALKQQLHLG